MVIFLINKKYVNINKKYCSVGDFLVVDYKKKYKNVSVMVTCWHVTV